MRIDNLILGPLDTNCWVLADEAGGPVIIVDPAADAVDVLLALGEAEVAAIVLTHGHADHIAAVDAVRDRCGAPLLIHADDAERVTDARANLSFMFGHEFAARAADRLLAAGDVVAAGELALTVLHTPGHTPGSICLLGHGHLISGDTLFAGSVGRSDLPGGDTYELRRSIIRLAELPDETRVHPGHGPETTIGRERRVNPYFPRSS